MDRRRAAGLTTSVALHTLALATSIYFTADTRMTGGDGIEVAAVPLSALTDAIGDPIVPEVDPNDVSAPGDGRNDIDLPGFQYDFAKVGARKYELFPFLTDGLPFLEAVQNRFLGADGALLSPFPRAPQPSSKPALQISDAELRRIVDGTWSRRDRWRSFASIADLVADHDPQEGRSAELVRTYLDQNLLQPYYDTATRDPRYWVMLGLAADHGRMIDFIGSFAQRHPSSRVTTELLFLLDEFAQGSRDALLMMEATDPDIDLTETLAANGDAFQLALEIQRFYAEWLRERGGDSPRDIRLRYDALRLRILTTILSTTPGGYGAADARFLIGRIFWDQNNVRDALGWWRDLRPDGRGMYARAAADITTQLETPSGATASNISAILGAEYRRWLEFSQARLRTFGYAFDTF